MCHLKTFETRVKHFSKKKLRAVQRVLSCFSFCLYCPLVALVWNIKHILLITLNIIYLHLTEDLFKENSSENVPSDLVRR